MTSPISDYPATIIEFEGYKRNHLFTNTDIADKYASLIKTMKHQLEAEKCQKS